jgi:uncharacterized protein
MNALVVDPNSSNTITSYGPGWIKIMQSKIDKPCVVTRTTLSVDSLPNNIMDLNIQNMEPIVSLNPEVVIIGTGKKQLFLDKKISSTLTNRRIGVEYMDTAAACRSFNILLAEERSVLGIFYMIV